MHHTIAKYAQFLAASLWFRSKSIKPIAESWDISEDAVRFIQKTQEYRSAVEELMRTTRSPRNILKWIERESSVGFIPSGLAERMGLPEPVISEMIEKLKHDIQAGADEINDVL